MKNFFKVFGSAALIAAIGFLTSCDFYLLNLIDEGKLNGTWYCNDRGITIEFDDGKGYLDEIDSHSSWNSIGVISEGDIIIEDLDFLKKYGENQWIGKVRTYTYTYSNGTNQITRGDWELCRIVMEKSKKIKISTSVNGIEGEYRKQ